MTCPVCQQFCFTLVAGDESLTGPCPHCGTVQTWQHQDYQPLQRIGRLAQTTKQ
jgi:hypothetical protein